MMQEKERRAHRGKYARQTCLTSTIKILARSWREGAVIFAALAICAAVVYAMGALYAPSVVAL